PVENRSFGATSILSTTSRCVYVFVVQGLKPYLVSSEHTPAAVQVADTVVAGPAGVRKRLCKPAPGWRLKVTVTGSPSGSKTSTALRSACAPAAISGMFATVPSPHTPSTRMGGQVAPGTNDVHSDGLQFE